MFVLGDLNPSDIGTKWLNLQIMFWQEYWEPNLLSDPSLSKIKDSEEVITATPTEFVKRELRIHVNQVLVETNEGFHVIFSMKKSFKNTVNIISRIFC